MEFRGTCILRENTAQLENIRLYVKSVNTDVHLHVGIRDSKLYARPAPEEENMRKHINFGPAYMHYTIT